MAILGRMSGGEPMLESSGQPKQRASSWWSLKSQIRALGLLFLVTVLLVTLLAIQLVRGSEAARIAEARRGLAQATAELRTRYARALQALAERRARETAPPWAERGWLTSVTASALAGMAGVEGGFYFASGSRLVGYAYPTYRGSGPKSDIPSAERPTILKVAEQAVATQEPAARRIDAGSDVLLFHAVPLQAQGSPGAAAWVMHHLEGVHGAYQSLHTAGLLLVLMVCGGATAAAWRLTRRLEAGVAGIEAALGAMEYRLETDIAPTGIRELDRIAAAIGRLGKTLILNQQRQAELEQKLRHADRLAALGRLVAGVAHEVRNPLASIKLKLHLAAQSGAASPERRAGAFAVMRAEVARIDRLVERLLALGRPRAPAPQSVDLRRYLAQRLEAFAWRAKTSNTALELSLSPSLGDAVRLDCDRLSEVLDNLLANALEAAAGGRVVVEAERNDGQLVIRVKDSGAGVAPAMRARLFEPFATTKPSGMGLGLFLSAEIVRGLGGEIVYREPDEALSADRREAAAVAQGACFEVRLPC